MPSPTVGSERNSYKKAKAANMMVQKVAAETQLSRGAKATNEEDGSSVASSSSTLKLSESMSDKFDKANECMADAVTAQVMAMLAP